ncbi:hypothetical protein [Haloplanus pelagicus]|uniref:hypothetical protein n=1 Tax=Haloplanus pelagicus TaxID=2949995 RepID=UPI0020418248|nr:hypothetical protein [Haloplanus sp. HW8-1]
MDVPERGDACSRVRRYERRRAVLFGYVQATNELGVTIFMIEQNVRTGLRYGDYASVMDDGRTRFHGPADSTLDDPEIREAYLGENVAYEG